MTTPRHPCFGSYEIDKAQERRCATCKDSMDCASQDEARIDVIGQNGNTGDHYNESAEHRDDAPGLLRKAAWLMMERARQYDRPAGERSMAKTVAAFNGITGQDMTVEQGWMFMATLKHVRFFQNPGKPHRDSVEDAIAYAALFGEAALMPDRNPK